MSEGLRGATPVTRLIPPTESEEIGYWLGGVCVEYHPLACFNCDPGVLGAGFVR